jgi:hypothetical protein
MMTREGEARREFCERFGPWYSLSLEEISRADFFSTYRDFLPPELSSKKCGLEYYSKLHFNLVESPPSP